MRNYLTREICALVITILWKIFAEPSSTLFRNIHSKFPNIHTRSSNQILHISIIILILNKLWLAIFFKYKIFWLPVGFIVLFLQLFL